MSETHMVDLVERVEVDPPTKPDERGWVAVSAFEAVYNTSTLVADVDDGPLAVESDTYTVTSVHYVPPDSPRLRRLVWEREHGLTDPTDREETDQ